MFKLRTYQQEAVDVGLEYFKSKKPVPSLEVLPTAAGKSLIISKIAHETGGRVLVLQPTKELLEQNYQKLIDLGGNAEVYSASLNSREIGDITYATIGSIVDMGQTFKELGFRKVIIDEADRYPREPDGMLRKFLSHLQCTHVLGLTATPLKLQSGKDQMGNAFSKLVMLTSSSKKGNFFKKIIHVTQIKELVSQGFWSPLVYHEHKLNTSRLRFNTTGSDYTDKSVVDYYEEQNLKEKIINFVLLSNRKSILIAVPSVEEAIELAKEIPDSVAVYGDMDKKDRTQAMEDFKSMKKRVAINVNLWTIGFDHPRLDCIISSRATASLSWWYQFVGRITRIHPNKKDGLIVDFAGNVERFGKVEELVFKQEGNQWKLYGEQDRLLTGVAIQTGATAKTPAYSPIKIGNSNGALTFGFGKYKGELVSAAPKWYLEWMMKNFDFRSEEQKQLQTEIKKVLNI